MSKFSVNEDSPLKKDEPDGLFNKLLNRLPLELHIPGYNYLGV